MKIRHPFYEYLSRKGWTYNQLNFLYKSNRVQRNRLLLVICLGGIMWYSSNHNVKSQLPQLIHFPKQAVVEEIVEKKESWTDSLGNQRYQCILAGTASQSEAWLNWDLQVVDFDDPN